MSKRFGAVQNANGNWQLCYLDSFHGPDGKPGPKNLCWTPDPDAKRMTRDTILPHDHATVTEAECCAVALAQIGSEAMPEKMEAAKGYVTPWTAEEIVADVLATGNLADDAAVETEVADDNETYESTTESEE